MAAFCPTSCESCWRADQCQTNRRRSARDTRRTCHRRSASAGGRCIGSRPGGVFHGLPMTGGRNPVAQKKRAGGNRLGCSFQRNIAPAERGRRSVQLLERQKPRPNLAQPSKHTTCQRGHPFSFKGMRRIRFHDMDAACLHRPTAGAKIGQRGTAGGSGRPVERRGPGRRTILLDNRRAFQK